MPDIITLTGIVGSDPRSVTTGEGLAITSFRLASSQRRFDRQQQKWVDGETNWYTITTFRQLATNCAVSIKRSERVVVTGRLRIRDWTAGERSGTNVEVDADSVGHDLAWGTAAYSRTGAGAGGTQNAEHSAQDAAGFPTSHDERMSAPDSAPLDSASLDSAELDSADRGAGALVAAGAIETPF